MGSKLLPQSVATPCCCDINNACIHRVHCGFYYSHRHTAPFIYNQGGDWYKLSVHLHGTSRDTVNVVQVHNLRHPGDLQPCGIYQFNPPGWFKVQVCDDSCAPSRLSCIQTCKLEPLFLFFLIIHEMHTAPDDSGWLSEGGRNKSACFWDERQMCCKGLKFSLPLHVFN